MTAIALAITRLPATGWRALMRSDLDHLPANKQAELAHVVRVLFEELQSEIGLATQTWKKRGRILKAILYGSYARADWVDDPVGGYKSDNDILVVVNDARLTDRSHIGARPKGSNWGRRSCCRLRRRVLRLRLISISGSRARRGGYARSQRKRQR